ncbi:MAG: DUF3095 domain-containing protein [Rhizobiaceae bacterium]
MSNETARFTRSLYTAERFSDALDETAYVALPDDWYVATTDVVGSRKAIADGRYKAVNMAGVAMISAIMNALETHDIPYVFGGDGAIVALAPDAHGIVSSELSRLVTFARSQLELELRAALVPVSRIRSDGHDVRVEAVRISPAIVNYAFSGGGASHAEKLMKSGEYLLNAAPEGESPNLDGLSCRWKPISVTGKKILSLIVEPTGAVSPEQFTRIVQTITEMAGGEYASPVPIEGPSVGWPPAGLELEARASKGTASLMKRRLVLIAITLFAWFLFQTGKKAGRFDPQHYRKTTGSNTDYRKLQDGLRMTLALDSQRLGEFEKQLQAFRAQGLIRYGTCIQDNAIMTCYVPSPMEDDHFHFLDGAGGGYAAAASAMS